MSMSAAAEGDHPVGSGRAGRYLVAAVCLALITIMLWPLVMSFLASIKPSAEAATAPPHYLPRS